MCRSSCSLFVLFILLLCPIQGVAFEGFEIVGVGTNPATALRDGIRQIGEIFGGVNVFSESEVQDFVLKADRIKTSSNFTGSKLDRFFQGVAQRDGLWYARFSFPEEFVRSVQSRQRDARTTKLTASWDVFEYTSGTADSFGEVHSESVYFRIPTWFKEFVDYYVVDTERSSPLVACVLILAGLTFGGILLFRRRNVV